MRNDAAEQSLERTAVPLRSLRVAGFGDVLWLARVTGVITAGPLESYALVDAYFGLLDELRSLLGEVDLVMVGAVKNPYIARAIAREKQLLYAA